MNDMVTPLVVCPEPSYVSGPAQEVYNDYFGQWIRGSEVVPCDVQQFGDTYGQQP